MARRWQIVLGLTAAAMVAATPLVYSSHRTSFSRNFRVVEEGVLYRSGQLSPAGLGRVIRERGIRTVISLRDPGRSDSWEERFCADRGVTHVRIEPRVWHPNERGDVPADDVVRKFLDVMEDRRNHPVLVHCFAGIHRTGTMCAIFRMKYHGWPAERAMNEMQQCGFEPEDLIQDIDDYLRGYSLRKPTPRK
jgi:tyrosine-protein phosphatase SIW14